MSEGLSNVSPQHRRLDLVNATLLLHAAATLAMTGLIWFVQLVHYPLLPHAAQGDFRAFAEAYQRRTGWVVVPLMLTEAATATLLLMAQYRRHAPLARLAAPGLDLAVDGPGPGAAAQPSVDRLRGAGGAAAGADQLVAHPGLDRAGRHRLGALGKQPWLIHRPR